MWFGWTEKCGQCKETALGLRAIAPFISSALTSTMQVLKQSQQSLSRPAAQCRPRRVKVCAAAHVAGIREEAVERGASGCDPAADLCLRCDAKFLDRGPQRHPSRIWIAWDPCELSRDWQNHVRCTASHCRYRAPSHRSSKGAMQRTPQTPAGTRPVRSQYCCKSPNGA